MFFTYVIYSKSIDKFYIGHTENLQSRIDKHNSGSTRFTSQTSDWQLK